MIFYFLQRDFSDINHIFHWPQSLVEYYLLCIFVPERIIMSAIFLLIGISLVVAVGFLIAFLWAVKNNQYEDDYTPSVRMLFNDTPSDNKEQTKPE